MSTWFCEYTKDGHLTMHLTIEAIDREDAFYILENDCAIYDEDILDLHEVPV